MLSPSGKPFTISEITQRIKRLVDGTFRLVQITGELSDVRSPSANGHLYFTIKDADAQISAVLFAGSLRTLAFKPENGMKVVATGDVSVYAKRGTYQIVVRKMTVAGQGDLMARFEEMKRKLAAEGLFAAERKRPLPVLPRHIGIVTAPTGAAIRDILNVLERRYPNLDILIAPARVQGDGAAAEIAAGVRALNKVGVPGGILPGRPRPEVIIVTRGGGSLEDLWPFNEEAVARAVHESEIPVLSAVGHEIDFSICDFVADYRAPTPSAAAEVVVRPKADLLANVDYWREKLDQAVDRSLSEFRSRLNVVEKNRVFSEPAHAVETYSQDVDALAMRMEALLESRMNRSRERLRASSSSLDLERTRRLPEIRTRIDRLAERSARALDSGREDSRRRLDIARRQLEALSPVAVLERGYSITLLENGRALRDPSEAPAGTALTTRLAHGKTVSSVVGGAPARSRPRHPKAPAEEKQSEQLGFDF